MKKILVPCDFSTSSREAFRFAVQLAERSDGVVYVLKATPLPVLPEPGIGLPEYAFDAALLEEIHDEAQRKLAEFIDRYHISGENVHLISETGPVIPTIRKVSEREDTDLIVMGTEGSHDWIDSFMGTNTANIVRNSRIPVIALRHFVPVPMIRNIVFPTQLSLAHSDAVVRVKKLRDFFGAQLHILFVNTPGDFHRDADIRRHMDAFFAVYGLDGCSRNTYNDDSCAKGIVDFAREVNADLIAMATHRRKTLTPLFNSSVTLDVLDNADCPVWSCMAS